jgi:hypothetical protein
MMGGKAFWKQIEVNLCSRERQLPITPAQAGSNSSKALSQVPNHKSFISPINRKGLKTRILNNLNNIEMYYKLTNTAKDNLPLTRRLL